MSSSRSDPGSVESLRSPSSAHSVTSSTGTSTRSLPNWTRSCFNLRIVADVTPVQIL